MRSLPLFHAIAGKPVIVLGTGEAAQAKRRLVERAGGQVLGSIAEGFEAGARLAFIAHADPAAAGEDAIRLRSAGVLVNVADRPELCDFTTPSILDRDPVLIAIGTAGASAGLAKALRLRLEAVLPQRLGQLAMRLQRAREALRARWPDAAGRRHALDIALSAGGALDPLDEQAADRLDGWLDNPGRGEDGRARARRVTIVLSSDDPEDLTLRQARLLGSADAILHDSDVANAILDRARADAIRLPLPHQGNAPDGLVIELRRA